MRCCLCELRINRLHVNDILYLFLFVHSELSEFYSHFRTFWNTSGMQELFFAFNTTLTYGKYDSSRILQEVLHLFGTRQSLSAVGTMKYIYYCKNYVEFTQMKSLFVITPKFPLIRVYVVLVQDHESHGPKVMQNYWPS